MTRLQCVDSKARTSKIIVACHQASFLRLITTILSTKFPAFNIEANLVSSFDELFESAAVSDANLAIIAPNMMHIDSLGNPIANCLKLVSGLLKTKPGLRVIILTTMLPAETDREEYERMGVAAVLDLPMELKLFIEAVQTALES